MPPAYDSYAVRRHDHKMLPLEVIGLVSAEGLAGTWCSRLHSVPTPLSLCLLVRIPGDEPNPELCRQFLGYLMVWPMAPFICYNMCIYVFMGVVTHMPECM